MAYNAPFSNTENVVIFSYKSVNSISYIYFYFILSQLYDFLKIKKKSFWFRFYKEKEVLVDNIFLCVLHKICYSFNNKLFKIYNEISQIGEKIVST